MVVATATSGRTRTRSVAVLVAVASAALVLTACFPTQPSAGRGSPVQRVFVMGDSMTFGLFGTTPRVHESLGRLMADRGVQLRIDGFPGETPLDPWPGNAGWAQRMQQQVSAWDPDMIVIQSTLFTNPDGPGRQAAYLASMRRLLDIATSRGAHVYLVSHATPPGAQERRARDVSQALQAQAAAGRGISTIPLDFWMQRCEGGVVSDGWHLTAKGQDCHALAVALAVDQLKGVNG